MMYSQIVILVIVALSSMAITACKETEHLDPTSLQSANDQAKIAVNYFGDDNCRIYLKKLGKEDEDIAKVIEKNKGLSSHLLDGQDGELITEQYRTSNTRRNNLKLSGDRFFSREPTGDEALTIETIEENCRRLLLSVDSSKKPEITLKHGFIAKDQQKLFSAEFSNENRFGEITCHDDKFCTFSKINDGNRYFVYLEPASTHSDIVLGLKYHVGEESESIDTVTVKNIKFKDGNRYQDKKELGYVSHLYVALAKSDNFTWTTQSNDPHFKVVLKTGSTEQNIMNGVGKLMLNDVSKQVVSFKVATICQKLLADKCNEDFSNFRRLLLADEARLTFGFFKKTENIGELTIKLTQSFVDNWLQRKGDIYFGKTLDSQWSSFKFTFINTSQQHLYLHPTEIPRNSSYQITNQACNQQRKKAFGTIFSPPQKAAMINRQALLNHFDGCSDFERSDDTSNLEFLKQSAPYLVIKIGNSDESYRYNFTDESIDNWWHEIGEIIATATTNNEGSGQPAKELVIGLQDRR